MNMEIEITSYIDNPHIELFQMQSQRLLDIIKEKLELTKTLEIAVEIVTQAQIKEINKNYRSIDKATDVLSFPMYETLAEVKNSITIPVSIGDILISYDQAVLQATEYEHTIERELAFLLCHGILHLLGFDHIIASDAKEMETLQEVILNEINIKR